MPICKYALHLLIAIALSAAEAAESEPHKVIVAGKRDTSEVVIRGLRDPSTWFRIESQHLIVYSDSDPEQVIELVNNLERLDYLLRLYLKPFLIRQMDEPKLTLYFEHRLDWTPGLGKIPDDTLGLVNSCVSGTQAFTFNLGRMWKSNNASLLTDVGDMTQWAIFSLYSKNFLNRHTDIRGPEWFIQGFGLYFGGVRFTDDQMAVGRAPGTSADVMKALDYANGNLIFLTYDQVLSKDVPQRFFGHLKKGEIGTAPYLAEWEFQSRSFNLLHYMLSSAENRDKMAQYLDAVNTGSDGGKAFADVFGLSGSGLASTMSYYRRALMKVIKVEFPELPAARIDFTRLSRLEGEFVLDNAALKACPAPGDGKDLLHRLQRAAAGARAVDFAQLTLSRAQIEWGDPRDAIPYLTAAVGRDPNNEEFHYLLGLAHLKLAEGPVEGKHALLEEARSGLAQAALLAPGRPDISYALFRAGILDTGTPPEKALALAIGTWRQGHDVPAFARLAALSYAWLGDSAGAYRAFNTLVRNGHDPNSAAWAMQWLSRLEKGVEKDELLAAMRDEPFASPGARQSVTSSR